jgi:hypothetical protein
MPGITVTVQHTGEKGITDVEKWLYNESSVLIDLLTQFSTLVTSQCERGVFEASGTRHVQWCAVLREHWHVPLWTQLFERCTAFWIKSDVAWKI